MGKCRKKKKRKRASLLLGPRDVCRRCGHSGFWGVPYWPDGMYLMCARCRCGCVGEWDLSDGLTTRVR